MPRRLAGELPDRSLSAADSAGTFENIRCIPFGPLSTGGDLPLGFGGDAVIELPDVERMIEGFAGYATGKTISAVLIDDPDLDVDPKLASEKIESHAIDTIERHGKNIVLRFRSEYSLVFDMGDEGRIYLESQTVPPDESSGIRLQFAAGRELRFDAPGTRDTVRLVELAKAHPRSSLKGFLMNPAAIAGIGNEYADEICFQAGYRPDLKIGAMSERQLERVHLYLRRVLRRATLHWQAAHADPGWLINHRGNGAACPRCSTELTTITLTGRKTFVCVRCQRAA
jgi:formamidopyrimidine-DNA glycosylase